jgi:hypothetical protein
MIGTQPTGALPGVVISAVAHEGLSIMVDGRPGQLAVLNGEGRVVARGQEVADEAESVAVNSYRAFLLGHGHLRLLGKPIERIEAAPPPRPRGRPRRAPPTQPDEA